MAKNDKVLVDKRELTAKSKCIEAIKENINNFKNISMKFRKDRDLCLMAVKKSGYALEYVPDEIKDEELCYIAVGKDNLALKFVPESLKTKKVCLKALSKHSNTFELIPEELRRDSDIYREAFKEIGLVQNKMTEFHMNYLLNLIPTYTKANLTFKTEVEEYHQKYIRENYTEKLKTLDDWIKLIKKSFHYIRYAPTELFEDQGFHEWVKKSNDIHFELFPAESLNEELLFIAVEKDWKNLSIFPDKVKDENICKLAVKENIEALKYVPQEYITEEYALELMDDGRWEVITYITDEKKTKYLCFQAVELNWKALAYVPEKLKNKDQCLKIFAENFEAIKYIPESFISNEAYVSSCYNFVMQSYYPMKFSKLVPYDLLNNYELWFEVANKLLLTEPKLIKKLDELYISLAFMYLERNKNSETERFITDLLKASIEYFKLIPDEFKTRELCLKYVKSNRQLKHVPKEHKEAVMEKISKSNK